MTARRTILVVALLAGLLAAFGAWQAIRLSETPKPPISGAVAHFTLMEALRPMPADPFSDGHGAERSLADYRGRVLLVNFWATWCLPCKVEMPSLDRLEAAMGGPEFAVVPISLDREGAEIVLPYYEQAGLEHLPVALDPGNAIANALGITALPTTILVDRDGNGIGYALGPAEWDAPEAQALIRYYMDRAE
jgi:thiol-disulfide isomerase/thioredoxin